MSCSLSLLLTGVCIATVSVSAYTNSTGAPPYQGLTASGVYASWETVAAGPGIPFGTVVWIPGVGRRIVQDRGGAITDGHLDVWAESLDEALAWGRREIEVVFYLTKRNGCGTIE